MDAWGFRVGAFALFIATVGMRRSIVLLLRKYFLSGCLIYNGFFMSVGTIYDGIELWVVRLVCKLLYVLSPFDSLVVAFQIARCVAEESLVVSLKNLLLCR